jgi:hypothetical protein
MTLASTRYEAMRRSAEHGCTTEQLGTSLIRLDIAPCWSEEVRRAVPLPIEDLEATLTLRPE